MTGSLGERCAVDTGACECFDEFAGDKCDRCKFGFYAFPACRACNCDAAGTRANSCDNSAVCQCDETGECPCKVRASRRDLKRTKGDFFHSVSVTDLFCRRTLRDASAPNVSLAPSAYNWTTQRDAPIAFALDAVMIVSRHLTSGQRYDMFTNLLPQVEELSICSGGNSTQCLPCFEIHRSTDRPERTCACLAVQNSRMAMLSLYELWSLLWSVLSPRPHPERTDCVTCQVDKRPCCRCRWKYRITWCRCFRRRQNTMRCPSTRTGWWSYPSKPPLYPSTVGTRPYPSTGRCPLLILATW